MSIRTKVTVIGDTVNVAARLQDKAVAGQILIGDALAVHEVIRIVTPSA